MMKRVYIVLMVTFIWMFSVVAMAEEETVNDILHYGDYEYYINEHGTATISGWSGEDEILVIPEEINGLLVTEIGMHAFTHNDFLTSITIPDSITEIHGSAFGNCSCLTGINVSPDNENYAVIGNVLFEKKSKTLFCYPAGLTDNEYVIPDGINRIGDFAFFFCERLTNIEIPESVTKIGSYAFSDCVNLTSIEIPKSVTEIEDNIFSGCYSLVSIEFPETVTRIGDFAFSRCHSLTSIEIPESVTEIGQNAFSCCYNLASIEIPELVTEIRWAAFADCISLTSMEIPDSVTAIESYAFTDCENLTNIEIPDSITQIGDGVFDGCEQLTITVVRDSYAAQYAKDNGIKYMYPDSNDWLND